MRTYKAFLALFLLIAGSGCESDSTTSDDNPRTSGFLPFSAITREGETYYSYRYDSNFMQVQRTNLNTSLGFDLAYRVILNDEWATVVTRNPFGVRAQSTTSSTSFVADPICTEITGAIDAVESSGNYTLFKIYEPNPSEGAPSHFIGVYDQSEMSCTLVPYPNEDELLNRFVTIFIDGNRAFLLSQNVDRGYSLYTMNLSNKTFSEPKLFSSSDLFWMVIDQNTVYTFYSDGRLQVLNASDLNQIEARTHGVNTGFFGPSRFYRNSIINNQMVVDAALPQPGTTAFTPVIVDIDSGELQSDISLAYDVAESLQSEYPILGLGRYRADLGSKTVVFSSSFTQSDSSTAVLLIYTNFEGEILGTQLLNEEELVSVYLGN